MISKRSKKPLVVGFAAGAAALMIASAAFGCVQSRGQLSIIAGGTSKATGNGKHPGAGPGNYIYCTDPTAGAVTVASNSPSLPGPGTFQVRMDPAMDCAVVLHPSPQRPWITSPTPNVFPDGKYEVNFCQGQDGGPAFVAAKGRIFDSQGGTNPHGSCFFSNGVTDWGTLVGTINVKNGTSQAGPKTFDVPFGSFTTPSGTFAGVAVRCTNCAGALGVGPPPVNAAPISLI